MSKPMQIKILSFLSVNVVNTCLYMKIEVVSAIEEWIKHVAAIEVR